MPRDATEQKRERSAADGAELLDAMAFALHSLRLVLEPSGAASLADRRGARRGRRAS